MHSIDDEPGQDAFGLGPSTLKWLLKLRPMTNYFFWLADRLYVRSWSVARRNSQHKQDSPKFYWLCAFADFVIQLAAVLVLAFAAGMVIYKSIWR